MLNCFKDHKICIHILHHIFDFFQQRKTRFTMEQPYMLPILYMYFHMSFLLMSWWLKEPAQDIRGHGIDPAKPECHVSSIRRVEIYFFLKQAVFLCFFCFISDLFIFLAATKQLYKWYFPSVRPSVRLSICPSVRHTFLTMFPSSYHHEIFRSYYQWPT